MRERASFFILQEFARSGLIDRIYILDNKVIEYHLEEVSILNYWEKINETISSTVHMINYFKNTPNVMSTASGPPKPAKVQTLGFVNTENNEEKLFYDLQYPRHKIYYYAINDETLKTDKKLLPNIKKYMEKNTTENCASGYSIHGTGYEENYCYVELFSSFIQEQYLPER